jgi:hypothetical protein
MTGERILIAFLIAGRFAIIFLWKKKKWHLGHITLFSINILDLRKVERSYQRQSPWHRTVIPATWKAKAGGLQVGVQPGLLSKEGKEGRKERLYLNCTNVMRFFSPPDSSSSCFLLEMLNILVRKSLPTSSSISVKCWRRKTIQATYVQKV